MNNAGMPVRTSNEAMMKLQEKRNKAGRTILFMVFGAFLLIIPPVGIAVLLYAVWRVQKLRSEMRELYKDAFVREPLMNNFENVHYEPNGGFLIENIEAFQLCDMGNSFWSEDYIQASYQGVNFEVAEVHVRQVDHSSDRDRSETYFEGRMMVFNFPNKLVSSVSVFSRKFTNRPPLSRREEKETKVELEMVQFNKEFDVYSESQQDAFYLITPHFMERLLYLAGRYESIAMHVVGNRVFLGFNEPGKDAFDADIDVGKLDIDKEMAKVQAEIDDIKTLITMILNLRTFV